MNRSAALQRFGLRGVQPGTPGFRGEANIQLTPEQQQRQTELRDLRASTIRDLNDALDRAAKATGNVTSSFEVLDNATEAQKNAMIESARQTSAEAETRARELAQQGVAVTGRGGGGLRGRDFEVFAQQFAQGRLIADPSLLLRQTENQRKAQMQQLRISGQIQRQQDIPASFLLGELAAPTSRFGTTFSTQGLAGNPEGQKTLENIEQYSKLSADAQVKIRDLTERGQAAAERIVANIDNPGISLPGRRQPGVAGIGIVDRGAERTGGPGPAVQRFRALTSEIGAIGKQIQSITDNINIRAVNVQVTEYNNQIRITQRSLQDARDLWAAINGAVKNTLGGLQGQNLLLDRQNQLLSRRAQRLSFKSEDIGFKQADLQFKAQQMQFELAQRQINFQVAIAGFTAPGTTPAERAARIEEAKIEAEYAQKQLDLQIEIANMAREQLAIAREQANINRQVFQNQTVQQDNSFLIAIEEARRAIPDLTAQLNQLFAGRALVIDQAAAEKTISDLEKTLAPLQAEAEELLQEGKQTRDQVLSDLTNLAAQTGKSMMELVNVVSDAWAQSARSYINNFLIPVRAQMISMSGGTAGYTMPASARKAPGGIDTYSKATRFVAGEAGTETVVVLRNPREGVMSWGGMGGGGGTTVNVGGIYITLSGSVGSNDADLNATANKLAGMVEERINRKLGMIAGGGLN